MQFFKKKNYKFSFKKIYLALSSLSFFVIIFFLLFNLTDYFNFFKEFQQFNNVKKINEIVLGYDDSSAKSFDNYYEILTRGLKHKLYGENVQSVNMNIDYNNLLILENGRTDKDIKKWAKATVNYDVESKSTNKKLKIKLRAKGDRLEHRKNFSSMSFKVDVRGEELFLGMEEFSIQKPNLRGYAWESLYHLTAKKNDLLSLKYFPINLFINGKDHGLYMVEESFGKEVLERNNKKNGPIFSINEILGEYYPNVTYEVYSEDYWKKNNLDILNYSKKRLVDIKNSPENIKLESLFDIEKWAKFFAISDALSTYHGSIEKSVKLYFNPVTGKIEPIGFDGHHTPGFNKFIFLDLLNNNFNCIKYICDHSEWFMLFFNKKNKKFIDLYVKSLNYITSTEFRDQLDNTLNGEIYLLNNLFYSNFYRADSLWVKGIRLYYFDKSIIFKKIEYIKSKISEYTDYEYSITSIENINKNKFNKVEDLNSPNHDIIVLKDININNKNFSTLKSKIVVLKGDNTLNNVIFDGPFMINQYEGNLSISNMKINKSKSIKIDGTTWTGSMNVINSHLIIDNLFIDSNDSEDGVNIVNSSFKINNIEILNARSDAIDVDFGTGNIDNISCINVGNDCLDISGTTLIVNNLIAKNVNDKVISAGEKSTLTVDTVDINSSAIGVVSKDGSNVKISSFNSNELKLFFSAFTKKNMFSGESSINVLNGNNNFDIVNKNTLIGLNSSMTYQDKLINNLMQSAKIEKLMYGHTYGVKTER